MTATCQNKLYHASLLLFLIYFEYVQQVYLLVAVAIVYSSENYKYKCDNTVVIKDK